VTSGLQTFIGLLHKFRRPIVVLLHLSLVALSNYLAFFLRFDGQIPYPQAPLAEQMLPWLMLIRGVVFLPFRLYEGIWRYTGIWDLRNIIAGVFSSSLVFYVLVHYGFKATAYSRSIFMIDAVLLICFMGGLRLTRRICREVGRHQGQIRVLIYGAGDAGEMIVRDMRHSEQFEYEPVGFVDDDRSKTGQRIHGVPVLGTREDLPRILMDRRPQEILIAIPRADQDALRTIVKALEPFTIKITTLPSLREILDGRVTVSQIRKLVPEDLLTRSPIGLDPGPVRQLIKGRRVMVTGAGGSIGSELCRQIVAFGPATLILFERHENSLFAITNDLEDRGGARTVISIVGDVTDAGRLDAVMEEYSPEIVFHAAAHKHVPLMERNPCEAVKNNVLGTRVVAEAADRHGIDRFILISTDKAVNPTSVMGTTKRVAELLVQTLATGSRTSFLTVRFGNVLGSNGSVVPRFLEQIRAGGPLTITHPEMRRYFMLIPEAVQLVLHAAARGENRTISVLKMGEQVKVVDLARTLIRLAGFVPDEEIAITFVGLRPGERLQEELVGRDEMAETSAVDKILKVRQRHLPAWSVLRPRVAELERVALEGRTADVLRRLKAIVPEAAPERCGDTPARRLARIAIDGPSVWTSLQICPGCRSSNVHRSHAQTLLERARRSVSHKRLFRCHSCGWRGWQIPREPMGDAPGTPAADALTLTRLDTSRRPRRAGTRPAFSPNDLT